MLAAVLGALASGVVQGQSLGFYSREQGASIARDDKAVAVAYWEDTSQNPVQKWVYTAGYVTQNDGSGNPHTRLAVFKYNADNSNWPPPQDPPGPGYNMHETTVGYFPPGGAWTPSGQHAATAMAVDPITGDIVVTGYTTMESNGSDGSDRNYITIKYTKNLAAVWTGTGWGGVTNGARGYDFNGGDDTAVSVAVEPEYGNVIVTGTSSNGSNNDITTLRYNASGSPYSGWQSTGARVGVRRYNPAGGEDTAAEVGYMILASTEGGEGIGSVVVGTSYQGSTPQLDRIVLCYSDDGSLTSNGGWESPYGAVSGGDDYGTGLALWNGTGGNAPIIYVCGYSETDTGSPAEVGYVVARLDSNTGSYNTGVGWNRTWDPGAEDVALDIAFSWIGTQIQRPIAWVTGRSEGSGHTLVATAVFDDNGMLASGGYTAISGGENSGNSICAFQGTAMVAGTATSGVADTDVLVLWLGLTIGPPNSLTVDAALFPGDASGLPDEGWAIVRGAQVDEAFLCGASTYSSGYLKDMVTLKITGP